MSQTSHGVGGVSYDAKKRTWPAEFNVFLALIILVIVFELIGRIFLGDSFLFNTRDNVAGIFNEARLQIIILQVSIVGIIAIGVTQVIICGGIDLSSGSIVGATAMIAMSFAQVATVNGNPNPKAMFLAQGWTDLPVIVPVLVAIGCGMLAGLINGSLIAYTRIPPFIATLGMMVAACGVAKWYTRGQPVSMLQDDYAAIGANVQAARVSGINVGRHLIKVYALAGLLSGLAGVVLSARAITGQASMGVSYELDAIAAAVIGGTSLAGGVGRITGTVIGTIILGVMTSGFTFLRIDAYYQEIVKGIIIVAAVIIDQYRQRRRRKA
jgi:inositol transport system permease protein